MSYFMAVETNSPAARERELFLGALEKSAPAERAAYLAAACAADHALRQRIEDLLKEQEEVGSFLEAPALSGTPLISGPGGTEMRGVPERAGASKKLPTSSCSFSKSSMRWRNAWSAAQAAAR